MNKLVEAGRELGVAIGPEQTNKMMSIIMNQLERRDMGLVMIELSAAASWHHLCIAIPTTLDEARLFLLGFSYAVDHQYESELCL